MYGKFKDPDNVITVRASEWLDLGLSLCRGIALKNIQRIIWWQQQRFYQEKINKKE